MAIWTVPCGQISTNYGYLVEYSQNNLEIIVDL
eukprot:UN08966